LQECVVNDMYDVNIGNINDLRLDLQFNDAHELLDHKKIE